MNKLLLLPLMLLANCSSSNSVQQNRKEQMETTSEKLPQEQDMHIGDLAQAAEQQQSTQHQQAPIAQGIAGRVVWVSGNQMPSPDVPRSSGKKGVQRQVFIYELTNGAQATTTDGAFHTNIQTNLVKQVITDANGYFAVSLEPGRYSIFTKEEQGLFANLFDGENNIYPVEVRQGEVTQVEFLVNYEAAY